MKHFSYRKFTLSILSASILFVSPFNSFAETNETAKNKEEIKTVKKTIEIPDIDIESGSAILYDLNLGRIIYEKDADVVTPSASLAKVMTLSLASEAIKMGKVKEEDLVQVSSTAWKTGGSRMFLNVGAKVPFIELLKGMTVISGNDAAVSIAENLHGTTEEFVVEMNKKAQILKMKNSLFVSPNGLPKGDVKDTSTARDMMLLTNDYLKKYPKNLKMHKMTEYTTLKDYSGGKEDIIQSNRNPILTEYAGADGLKTGWVEGHYNFIGTAVKDDIRLVVVLMSASSPKIRSADAKKLLDYGFNQYSKVIVNKSGEEIEKIPVYKSKDIKKTSIVVKDDIELVLHNDDLKDGELKDEVVIPDYLTGGKKQGDVVGKKNIYLGNTLVVSADLVIKEDLPEATFVQKFFDTIAMFVTWLQEKIL